MNYTFILLMINDLLKVPTISIITNYYYNSSKVFNSLEKIMEIDIKNNINFDKII